MARTSLTKALAALLAIAGLLAAMALDAGSRHVVLVLGASGTREGPFANAPVAGVCWTACVLSVLAAAGVVLEWRGARRSGGRAAQGAGDEPEARSRTSSAGVRVRRTRIVMRLAIGLGIAGLLLGYLVWATHDARLSLSNIVVSAIGGATPLLLGSTAGVISERSGVINITIEGEFLAAACASAVVATLTRTPWLGLLSGVAAGAAVGAVLALFAVRYGVDQIVAGLILITLVTGGTGYLFGQVLDPHQTTLNSPSTFSGIPIPLLDRLPIVGAGVFDAPIIFYLAVAAIIVVELVLRRTVVGLRVRASGENPRAALGSGVNVRRIRTVVCIASGGIAGIGGAYFTIGSAGPFVQQMTAGLGYVALAAVIFGGWRATRAALAALLFGFGTSLETSLGVLNVNVNPELLIVIPYLVTIAALAGIVGAVHPPAADGVPLAEV